MAEHDPKLLATLGAGVRVANRYVIRRVLGKGGMGHVFEVENEAIGRRFALKILSLSFASDEAIKRFRREAKALGRVASARVAQVIDFDVDPALGPFLVMELLEGETLQQRLARTGRMPVDEVVALSIELCEALAEVHAAGIVHRDLKPSNVGLAKSGPVQVKLLDFGLAASVDDAFTERLTQSQQFLGTLPYMAPELFHGHPPTQALDLYALGVVMFEMLAGRTPFIATNPAQYVAQHLASPVPKVQEVAAAARAPAWLEAIIAKLLSKDAAERYGSATAVASALRLKDSLALDSTISAPGSGAVSGIVAATTAGKVSQRRRAWLWWVVAGLALVAFGGAVVVAMREKPAAPVVQAPTIEAAKPEAPKPEAPTIEAPKPEAPKPEAPKPEAPKPVAAPPIAAPPPIAEPPPVAATPSKPTKHTHKPAATKKPAKKSWNGEILDE